MNLLNDLLGLIPGSPETVCTVVAEFADGTTAVTTSDGALVRVYGTAGRSAGQKVLCQGGAILRDVPDLADYYFEV